MQVDIYDFDHTIVPMDSGSRFYFFCLLFYPWILLVLPLQLLGALLFALKIIDFSKAKSFFFCFVRLIPLKRAVNRFWDKHEKEVFPWFRERPRTAVVISASPDFLLEEIQKRLGFEYLICTRHNPKNGRISGENCRGEEKVKRFRSQFPDFRVVDVYSDSLKHDKPIFSLGENCFHIVNGEKTEFKYKDMYNQ